MRLETKRICIREFVIEDLGDLHEILGDEQVMEYMEAPYTKNKTREFLVAFCIGQKGALACVHKETNKVIGYILFNKTENNIYEIGWLFNKNYWRQGYAFESCSAVIRYAFKVCNAQKIFAETIDGTKSVGLMKKLGMTQEEILPKHAKDNKGNWVDFYVYGILEEEFEGYQQTEKHLYRQIQLAAKQTIEYIKKIIKPGMNLLEIRKACEEKLLELGADSFWYWDVGAFVFAGDETTVSVSGKQYVTPDRIIENNDIITIDLSPQVGNIWGDYARTVVVENGRVVDDIDIIENPEWKSGLRMEEKLHEELLVFATKETTFEELYYHMNEFIVENGFVNLDFMGNLGHSIVKAKGDRVYIEKGNMAKMGDVMYFTFEPHIAFPNSKYGFKKENIYYFDGDKLVEL